MNESCDVEIRFYTLDALRAAGGKPSCAIIVAFRILRWLRGRRETLVHCDVRIGTTVFACTRRCGCHLRFADWIKAKPDRTIIVTCAQPDHAWWYEQRKFTTVRTFLQALGLWKGATINCVTATSRFLCLECAYHTPDELLTALSNNEDCHGRR